MVVINTQGTGPAGAADDTNDDIDHSVPDEGDTEGVDHTDDANEGESVEDLRKKLLAAEERAERVKAESIKRRQRNSVITTERDGLLGRIEALELEAQAARAEAARVSAMAKHKLPAEAVELLGDDPDAIAKQAEVIAKILESKSANKAPAAGGAEPVVRREPTGGRVPQDRQNTVDMGDLIAQASRL